jgi:hypothetical protein
MVRASIIAAICVLQWSAFMLPLFLARPFHLGVLIGGCAAFAIQTLIALGGVMRLAAFSPFEERRKVAALATLRVTITQLILVTLLVGTIRVGDEGERILYSFMLFSCLIGGVGAFIMTSLQVRKMAEHCEYLPNGK